MGISQRKVRGLAYYARQRSGSASDCGRSPDRVAKEKFAAFLGGEIFTADQIRFVNYIIDHLTDGIFTDTQADELVKIVVGVNKSVAV